MKLTNDPFSLGSCLVFGFLLLDGQTAAAAERVVDCFRWWAVASSTSSSLFFMPNKMPRWAVWHLPFMEKVRASKEAPLPMVLAAHSLALTAVSLTSCIALLPEQGLLAPAVH